MSKKLEKSEKSSFIIEKIEKANDHFLAEEEDLDFFKDVSIEIREITDPLRDRLKSVYSDKNSFSKQNVKKEENYKDQIIKLEENERLMSEQVINLNKF